MTQYKYSELCRVTGHLKNYSDNQIGMFMSLIDPEQPVKLLAFEFSGRQKSDLDCLLKCLVSRLLWTCLEFSIFPKSEACTTRRVFPCMLKCYANAFSFEKMKGQEGLHEL